ncbi:MAG: hypothetical protein ACJA13_003500 [Paraglaciecola sp.]|jgi:hypothetical protein
MSILSWNGSRHKLIFEAHYYLNDPVGISSIKGRYYLTEQVCTGYLTAHKHISISKTFYEDFGFNVVRRDRRA